MCCDYIYDVSWLSPIVVVLIHDVVIHVVVTHVVVVFVLVVDIYTWCGCMYLFLVDDHLHYGFSSLCSVVNSQNYGTKER